MEQAELSLRHVQDPSIRSHVLQVHEHRSVPMGGPQMERGHDVTRDLQIRLEGS